MIRIVFLATIAVVLCCPNAQAQTPPPAAGFAPYFTNGLPVQASLSTGGDTNCLTSIFGTVTNWGANDKLWLRIQVADNTSASVQWNGKTGDVQVVEFDSGRHFWSACGSLVVSPVPAQKEPLLSMQLLKNQDTNVLATATCRVADVWFVLAGPNIIRSETNTTPPAATNCWIKGVDQTAYLPSEGNEFLQTLREKLPATNGPSVALYAINTDWQSMDQLGPLSTNGMFAYPLESHGGVTNYPIGCRGLVVWHGEADATLGSRVRSLFYDRANDMYALNNTNANGNLRVFYGQSLYSNVLERWWNRYSLAPLLPNNFMVDNDTRSKRVVLVQLEGRQRSPEKLDQWMTSTANGLSNIVIRSGYAAVRYAQFDVARVLEAQYCASYESNSVPGTLLDSTIYPFGRSNPVVPRVTLVPAADSKSKKEVAERIHVALAGVSVKLPTKKDALFPALADLANEYVVLPRFSEQDTNWWNTRSATQTVTTGEWGGFETNRIRTISYESLSSVWSNIAGGGRAMIRTGDRDVTPTMPKLLPEGSFTALSLPSFDMPTNSKTVEFRKGP